MEYNPQEIEKKWQKIWEEMELYKVEDFSKKPKKYILIEFPYPSGEGLHVGHIRSYSALDAVSRKKRMAGFNVLYPIGFDAFGLPTENYAIKTGVHPKVATEKNIANYKRQLKSLGFSFDWSREINTTDLEYYKWTQWIFLKLFEKGLAYQAEIPINFCPSCKIGLANEEVVGGACERCGTQVEKRVLKQWMIKITAYADRLIKDLEKVDFPERVKAQQINWIGRSEGVQIEFKIQNSNLKISVFTTRADTLFGVTAVVLAPEHPLVAELITKENEEEVKKYIEEAKKKSDFEREKLEKDKTGVFTGSYCINPANSEKVPIWVGDYVIATYGGGAVMMVPAHDKRDYDFAKKYGLAIKEVISGGEVLKEAFVDYGILINSGEFNGLGSQKAIEKITKWLEKKGSGKKTIQYKLRDWVFSRQHYWGEPIPIIHCEKCGQVPVPEKDLPVELPYIEKYQPTGTGQSPLAAISEWVNVKCPKCGGRAKRETDTMPNWAGSNWYYLRYVDPDNNKMLADFQKIKYWMPVDWYNGGMEHTTLHLLYSRFIYKFLWDIGAVPKSTGSEPYQKRTSHGMVLAEDGRKMSKSFGNVVNPDDIVKEYGADALRVYEMFMGPFDQAIAWNTNGLKGCYRFLNKVWNIYSALTPVGGKPDKSKELRQFTHKTIKKVSEDIENIHLNTAVSTLMEYVNYLDEIKFNYAVDEKIWDKAETTLLKLLAPVAPHICEELWTLNPLYLSSGAKSIFLEEWPKYDQKLIKEEKIQLIVQINGKVRDKIELPAGISEKEAKELVLQREKVKNWISGKEIKKIIFVPGRLINLVV